MILTIGEILFDIFPSYRQMGGAPFNFVFHLGEFGESVAFISRIGKDENGNAILHTLREKQFPTGHIQIDPDHPTGHVNVTLDSEGGPEFDIVKNVAYDHLEYTERIADMVRRDPVRLIYFGTLIQRTDRGAAFVRRMVSDKPAGATCFYDINLRPGCYDFPTIRRSLDACDILKINHEELNVLREMLAAPKADASFIHYLMETFAIEWVCLTRGKSGSTLFTPEEAVDAAPVQTDVADTVGAGDAYAAMLAKGWLDGWPPQIIVDRATRFSGAVCMIKGAIPDDPLFYQAFTNEFNKEESK